MQNEQKKVWQQLVMVLMSHSLSSIHSGQIVFVHSQKCTLLKVGTCLVSFSGTQVPTNWKHHLHIRLWCRGCNKIECQRGKLGVWHLPMTVLTECQSTLNSRWCRNFCSITFKFNVKSRYNSWNFVIGSCSSPVLWIRGQSSEFLCWRWNIEQ